ncbi:SDR family oxidoreductase [Parasphingorhabdus litoris]|uniref:SDR family oxidoreductase n=1 Tax=Parasphingorhabdus litoris TaxID=394733 RepID=A0ABP3JW08_9SPHN|nr:SDR family oxidoreductase [Parasphingorhabdus litoris]
MSKSLLKDKIAVIFGAGGSLGSEVTKKFVDIGAIVFASSRSPDPTLSSSGVQEFRTVDALDEDAVTRYLDEIVAAHGRIDIVLNLATSDHAAFNHGKPASETSLEELLIPARSTLGPQFVTAKAAQKQMANQRSGVILFITSTLAVVGSPWSAALSATHAGIEGLMRSLASEWGPQGIRVLGVRSEAMPDTPTIEYTFRAMGENLGISQTEMQGAIEQNKVALGRLPERSETANVLAFAASDLASFMTGTMLNHSGGHVLQ